MSSPTATRIDTTSSEAGKGRAIARALLGLAFAIPLCGISLISLKWLVRGVSFAFTPMTVGPLFASALLYLLLAAYEEIAFRGYPLGRLLPHFGIWPTLFLIAPMFILYHVTMG